MYCVKGKGKAAPLTPNALNEMFLTFEKVARYAVLIAKQSKTKYMKTAGGRDEITQQYIIERNQFEMVNEFTYFGTQINAHKTKEVRK